MNSVKDGLLFLDTADLADIDKFLKMGILGGVTTNPTIMEKCGVTGGFQVIREHAMEIVKLIGDLPLSLETSSPTGNIEEIMDQARDFHGWAPKTINVKINLTSQDLGIPYINRIMALIGKDLPATLGEANSRFEELSDLMMGYKDKSGKVVYYLEAIHKLSKEGIPVNATAMMSVSQCFLAAQAGAKYVSLFNGRIANMGYNPMVETGKLRSLLDRAGLPAQIIAASSREALNVVDWWSAGAHIVTVTPGLMKPCIDHPYTRDTAALFDKSALDWLPGWKKWHAQQNS